ncbi:hypothetical protein A2803_03420 [Candidatus Woesebacteria bacterium RIFCSPHIGHO2_01_FULL_44_21]|uniref:PIN domain-containing protein n=1 Tax=Candidatus Woesebacteria bacterium RIFCSPHIGHO2_01_FULL_44_21 TaxID=1802503 RepID=A0A1F7YYY6_9BACT|nr:MAG: hypothetical protein A2803_03420 [Candidatus Woesebacteria bacterium RIFCSPHIGHO2_01_FULL_44_21]OGM69119.1 MAG: hypothetical protein A2897_04820 [Candidatus Woesebacteria bacterium RIFCSPLOWO2_01_FULL_44_24b]
MPKYIAVDSSVIIKWLNSDSEDNLDKADALLKSKQLAVNKAKTVLEKFYNLPILYVNESQKLAQSTYEFASKFGLTYYDASFISLASQFGAILVTDNIKHQGKVKEVKVVELKNYNSIL